MRRLIRKGSEKAGLPPGTLIYTGERKAEKVKIRILDYDEAEFRWSTRGGDYRKAWQPLWPASSLIRRHFKYGPTSQNGGLRGLHLSCSEDALPW